MLHSLAGQKKIKNHTVFYSTRKAVTKSATFSVFYLLVLSTGPMEEQEVYKRLIPLHWRHSNPAS